jgi:hypothetical protein
MLSDIKVLLEGDYANVARNEFIHQDDDFDGIATNAREFRHDQGIGALKHGEHLINLGLLTGCT